MLKKLSLLTSLLFIYLTVTRAVFFESLESTTETGAPVFNQIKFIPGWHKDIWLMLQSHHGADSTNWDRLAIVVDKTQTPKVAKFYQLGDDGPIPLKARCFACHSNGPRAIRPKKGFTAVAASALLNLRIKSYGPVLSEEGSHFASGANSRANSGAAFKSPIAVHKKALELASCTGCHAEGGMRRPLTMEQAGTANFLVNQGAMPPFPFSISADDRESLKQLLSN